MKLALLADIHGNLPALRACLAHAEAAGAQRFAVLGDLVGYGPDPGAVVDWAVDAARDGALLVRGNHDHAVARPPTGGDSAEHASVAWTRASYAWAAAASPASATISETPRSIASRRKAR